MIKPFIKPTVRYIVFKRLQQLFGSNSEEVIVVFIKLKCK